MFVDGSKIMALLKRNQAGRSPTAPGESGQPSLVVNDVVGSHKMGFVCV